LNKKSQGQVSVDSERAVSGWKLTQPGAFSLGPSSGLRLPWKIAFSSNIYVMVKILSSEYQSYACGKIFLMP
jgi:hypothetical protein